MDKKREINFNLNNFLLALSLACDFKRKENFNSSLNYSKRVAFISLNIGKELNLNPQEMSDLCSYSLIHSIGLLDNRKLDKNYIESSNDFSKKLPFLLENNNILLYQKEYFDGSGLLGKKGENIPKLSQILSFSILLNEKFDLANSNIEKRDEVVNFVEKNSNILFNENLKTIFLKLTKNSSFWLDLENENDILYFIFGNLHDFTTTLTFEEVLEITSFIYNKINSKSNLLKLTSQICDNYSFEHKDKYTFLIAASLQNIGKTAIPYTIINKNESLNKDEYEIIKSYPYYTKKILINIMGFNDIASWAFKIQEKVDSSGYPFGLEAKDLSFKDRVLAILVAYDSLRNKKIYREAYSHKESIDILNNISGLDKAIIKDIEIFFN